MLDGLELSLAEAVFGGLLIVLAGYIRGLTGFALSAVMVAGLSFIIDTIDAVALALVFEVAASAIQGRSAWNEVKWRHLWVLLAAALIGNPFGVWILTTLDQDVLSAGLYVVLAVISVGLSLRHRGAIAPTLGLFFAVGIVAGVVNGATALSGLVLVLAMSFMTIQPIAMRSTLIAYFFVSNLGVVALLAAAGDVDRTVLWRLLAGLPFLAAGIFVGSSTFQKTPPERFRKITLVLLISISMFGLARLAVT